MLHALYIEVQKGFTFSIKMDLSNVCCCINENGEEGTRDGPHHGFTQSLVFHDHTGN